MTPRQTRRLTRADRADYYRAIYLGLGMGRSVRAVWEFCNSHMEKSPALSTLEKYSVDFAWVEAAAGFDQRQGVGARHTQSVWHQALDMDARHMTLGQAMQTAATDAIAETEPAHIKNPASFAERGVRIERLAAGKLIDRVTIMVDTLNATGDTTMTSFEQVLGQLDVLTDDDVRFAMSLFAQRIDDAAYQLLASRGIERPPTVPPGECGGQRGGTPG